MSHTEGKLIVNGVWIEAESGHEVAYIGLPDMNAQDARRLVACWNACSELDTWFLEDAVKINPRPFVENMKMFDALETERDELVEALRDLFRNGYSAGRIEKVGELLSKYPEQS